MKIVKETPKIESIVLSISILKQIELALSYQYRVKAIAFYCALCQLAYGEDDGSAYYFINMKAVEYEICKLSGLTLKAVQYLFVRFQGEKIITVTDDICMK